MIPKTIKDLCTPALAYFILGVISFLSILRQNLEDPRKFCLGKMSCEVPHIALVLVGKALYIAFWTWALNALCKSGHKRIAWLIFLLPVIFFFLMATTLITAVALKQ